MLFTYAVHRLGGFGHLGGFSSIPLSKNLKELINTGWHAYVK